MNALYHLVRADFLERTRRYSFLIMLGLVLWLGYLVNIGQVTLWLEAYRGVFNSAWVGSMMTLVVNFLLGWFGFYLIKNSIARDYETGVGQIIATTPLSRPKYMLGKWISNFLTLAVMVFILMLAAIVMQLIQREDAQIHLWALLAPFLFVALPFMALVAAITVLFESVRWLRGGFGNLVYFFLFLGGITTIAVLYGESVPLLDWLGFGVFKSSMAVAAKAAYPSYAGGMTLSLVPQAENSRTFYWPGVDWTLPLVLVRLTPYIWSIGIALLGALFFDRFDSTRTNPSLKRKPAADVPEADTLPEQKSAPRIHLTSLTRSSSRSRFGRIYLAELRLLLKGQPWWWYLAAVGSIAASSFGSLRQTALPFALILPVLIWSGLGNREMRLNTRQMVFSAPHPLWNQLSAGWLAGLTVAVLMAAGSAVTFIMNGATSNLISLLVGIIFIPSLALALGVWTGGSKTFEVVYVLFWYIGLLNKVPELDYIGLHTTDYWLVYLLLSLFLLAAAVFGRSQQLKGRLG